MPFVAFGIAPEDRVALSKSSFAIVFGLGSAIIRKPHQNDPSMIAGTIDLIAVESLAHKATGRELVREYLRWVADVARTNYGLIFNIDAMIESDIQDQSKFYPPTGRFYLLQYAGRYVGVGCLKRLAEGVGEIQRMFVQPQVRGVGAGRALVERLIQDAKNLGYLTVRLESLKALSAAHALYRSVGFVEIDPYSDNSMKAYQPPESLGAYRDSAVFMELSLRAARSDV